MARNGGFSLIELMVVIAIVAIIASIAIPNLMYAERAANEASTVNALRDLSSAQMQFQARTAIDADGDGRGEYGAFGELSGAVPLSIRDPFAPVRGLEPPILGTTFTGVNANGVLQRGAYNFQIYLPQAAGVGSPEGANGTPDPNWDDDECEIYWACYAWPVSAGSGAKAYFVNQRGQIYMTEMLNQTYFGAATPPFNAALTGPSMDSNPPINGQGAGTDGNRWLPVQ